MGLGRMGGVGKMRSGAEHASSESLQRPHGDRVDVSRVQASGAAVRMPE
jgi:hypothetical protein